MPDIPAFDASPYTGIQPPKTTYNPDYNPFNVSAAPPSSYSKPSKDWEQLYAGLERHASSQNFHPDENDYRAEEASPAEENPGLYDHVEDSSVSEKSGQHYQFKGRFILTFCKVRLNDH